jgi:hypothetical protein
MEMLYPDNIINVDYSDLPNLTDISTIVVREPLEHLQSALHTELLGWLWENLNEKLSTKNMIPLINNFITDELNQAGTTHWDINYYEHLYKFWKQNKDTIKVIHILDLTDFIKQEYGIDIPHDKFSYGISRLVDKFKYAYTSKEKLSKWIEETLPELWNEVVKELPKAEKFYNHLINETNYIEYDSEKKRKII